MAIEIREARTGDEPGIVRVIELTYEEYGFTWDAQGYCRDLYDLKAYYFDEGHQFWVAEDEEGRIVGTAALECFARHPGEVGELIRQGEWVRVGAADCSLERWYVHHERRGEGIGGRLLRTVLAAARARGRDTMEIWSDKKLLDAHQVYERYGARRLGERVLLDDPDKSLEWGFVLSLAGLDRSG